MTKDIIINDVLIPSLSELFRVDYKNIRFGVSERNICARLAHHMENIIREYDIRNNSHCFNNYFVDVEYNRMGNGDLKKYETNEHRDRYFVSDLLLQSRDVERNFLAVEMKRSYNANREGDRNRLKAIVSPRPVGTRHNCVYDTLVGAFVIYSKKGVDIEIYENVNGHGDKTDEMHLDLNDLMR